MKGKAARRHDVVIKSCFCKSGVGVCENALLLNCLMGVHMWKRNKARVRVHPSES